MTIVHDWQYNPGEWYAAFDGTIVRAAVIFRRLTGPRGQINGRNYWELKVEGDLIARSPYHPTMEQAIFDFSTFIQRLPRKDISQVCRHETFPIAAARRRFTVSDVHIFDTICAWRNDIRLFMENSSLQEDSYTCPFELMEVVKPNSLAKPAVADFEEV